MGPGVKGGLNKFRHGIIIITVQRVCCTPDVVVYVYTCTPELFDWLHCNAKATGLSVPHYGVPNYHALVTIYLPL